MCFPSDIFGEGPSLWELAQPAGADSKFNESKRKDLTAEDIRYTTKGDAIYAFVMGVPEKEAVIPALGTKSPQLPGKIVNVELLGSGTMSFQQNEDSLRVSLPETKPAEYAVALKVYRS